MTAVVGILNKQAVALAADSAVTITGPQGRTILNTANKLFTLSKYQPVGVMLYNSASFMSTPWETIIKIYRNKLGEKKFATLKEYQEDFLAFLKENFFFTTEVEQRKFLKQYVSGILDEVIKPIASAPENFRIFNTRSSENDQEILTIIEREVEKHSSNFKDLESCTDFKEYNFKDFSIYGDSIFEELFNEKFLNNNYSISTDLKDAFKTLCFLCIKVKRNVLGYTGLIFTGFGEDEIYPSLIPVNVSFAIDNKLKYFIDEAQKANISNDQSGAICPFAQTDVINTILMGIDPALDSTYLTNFEMIFNKYNQVILTQIGDSNPELSAQIKGLNVKEMIEQYNQINLQTKLTKYIQPLFSAVGSLNKEDLAEMAESLIYLTYLKRRITFTEESVGGPVDVAIISKGDGFIWIKRKHYFKPELNQHYFDNYFK